MNDWLSLDMVKFTEEFVKQYHVDTRDFHVGISNTPHPVDLSKIRRYPKRFFFTAEEVVELLNRLKEESGGDVKWRMLELTTMGRNWQLKYIRIYRTELGLVVANNSGRVQRKEDWEGKVRQEHLNAH